MSTSFEVYPTATELPTFSQVIEKLNLAVVSYMRSLRVSRSFEFNMVYRRAEEFSEIQLSEVFHIPEDKYLWVYVPDIPGGFCVNQFENNAIFTGFWQDEFQDREQSHRYQAMIEKSLTLPYHWSVTRYGGTPSFYNMAYGLCASVLADLTQGLIFTDDNAWDYDLFPCKPHDFDQFYLKPELTSKPVFWQMSMHIRRNIVKEFGTSV